MTNYNNFEYGTVCSYQNTGNRYRSTQNPSIPLITFRLLTKSSSQIIIVGTRTGKTNCAEI